MTDRRFVITAEWDDEAKVWYTSDSNVPGLATEADTLDELIRKLRYMVPEMLELNGVLEDDEQSVPFSLTTQVGSVPNHC